MPFNYTGGYEYLNIKWSISMHLMVYFNASGGSKVSIDGPFEMQYSNYEGVENKGVSCGLK